MKSLILLLFIAGLMFIIIGYMENYKNCPLPKKNIVIFLETFMKNK